MTAKELYKRERKNLQNRIRSWQKKGYELLIDIPAIPNRITKSSVKALQKLQLKDLVKKGKVVSREYGDVLTPYRYEEEQNIKRRDRRLLKEIQRKKAKQDYQDYLRAQEEREQERAEERELAEYYEALENREPWALTKYYAEHGRQYGEDEYDSSDFYAETGYKQDTVMEDEELIGEELDLYEENLDTINEPYLKQLFSDARQELGDEALSRDLQTNKTAGGYTYAQALQVSIGAIQRYKEEGRDDRANTEINQLITRLNYLLGRGPIDAQLSEQIAMGNYAP